MIIEIKKFDELSSPVLYNILRLRVEVFVVEQHCPYLEIDGKDQAAIHFYMGVGSDIKGYLRVYFRDNQQAVIGRVVVDADHRKDKLGTQLMQSAMQYLSSSEGVPSIFLQAQSHLSGFYAHFGFRIVSDQYLEDGIPHVDMLFE